MNSNDRTEANMSAALYTALFAGTCKSIITERDLCYRRCELRDSNSNAATDSEVTVPSDYLRGGLGACG